VEGCVTAQVCCFARERSSKGVRGGVVGGVCAVLRVKVDAVRRAACGCVLVRTKESVQWQ
jgi:hypothetical protein